MPVPPIRLNTSEKLIVASYRLPYRLSISGGRLKVVPSTGGLATALHSYFKRESQRGGKFRSFHWVGVSDLGKKSFDKVSSVPTIEDDDLILHPVFMKGRDSDPFYNGFCNSVLWPLFHYFPSYVIHNQQFFDAYQRANEVMADKILTLYVPGDVIWIHDYHFMLLPALLRKNIPEADIRFFLHIPFPAFEIFRILPKPWRMAILHGLLGSNVIGFHTDDYVHHFLDSIHRMLGLSVNENETLVH
jgi:trehalose 6-phosphate synthase/phosphatase